MSDTPSDVDLAIIGAGPTGLYAAFYAGLRGLSVKLIDSLELLGGQLATLYPEKAIYDVPGFPRVTAKNLVRDLVEQGLAYGATVCLGEQVRQLEASPAGHTIVTSRGAHVARSILIAGGAGSFAPRRLPLSGAGAYEGRGLHYFVHHIADFRDRRVLIVGGGDSAVDWANTLAGITRSQTLIHRRDVFRAHESAVAQMKAGPTQVRTFYELRELHGDGGISAATIVDSRTQQAERLEVDDVLVNIGFVNSLGPIKDWGLQLQGAAIVVDHTMRTNRPGIYAAGDICTYPGKLKLIVTGFAEAATAVNHAAAYLDPTARVFPGHSTDIVKG